MRIGVIGVQGDVSEHVDAVARAMHEAGKPGDAISVRRREDLDRVDALTIPGGESTTISKLLVQLGLFDEIVRRATDDAMPITRAPTATAPLRVTYKAGRRTARVELIVVVKRAADCGPKIRKSGMSATKAAASASSRPSIASRTAPSACARITSRPSTAPTALNPSIVRFTEWLSVVIASDSWTSDASFARIP